MESVPIISVTGTKGKTTVVSVVASILQELGKNVLKVDTTGHYVNGEQRSTLDDSKATWRLVPTVGSGRYLWEFFANPELREDGVAVLECALGSSGSAGLGYRYHSVGVFLNVFEDHLGSSDRLVVKEDIARAKQFVFERLEPVGSYAVFNADDALVVGRLGVIKGEPDKKQLVPFGLTFEHFDLDAHVEKDGTAFTVADNTIVLRTKKGDTPLVRLSELPWAFNGAYEPSVWNMLAAVAALYAFFKGQLPENFQQIAEAVRLDQYGGRLTVLKNNENVTVIADYAHEKVSLSKIGDLAKSLVTGGAKTTGVVRLAHDRTDDLMRDTGQTIASHFDSFVVYDKIDGYWRKAKNAIRYPQIVGRTSDIFADAIKQKNPNVERILREDEAIKRAAEIAKPGDVVVVIVNDDIKQSIGFIKDSFKADFV